MEKISAARPSFREDISLRHLDVLDGMRVLFVLMVAWFHIWQQSWLQPAITLFGQKISLDFLPRTGYIFVDGMLLLSGLLLFLPCAGAKGKLPKTAIFYKKRLIRILPSYLLCVFAMLAAALIKGSYTSFSTAAVDVASHLTFTHTFFRAAYQETQLNGALWTLAIEMQFYLLFPLLARAYKKKPALTFCLMTGAAFLYRAYVSTLPDTALLINQLPAFLDVYALGFAGATAITALSARFKNEKRSEKLLFTVGAVICIVPIIDLLKSQAGMSGYENIRLGQLINRFPLCVLLLMLMICLCYSLPAVRFLLGNRLMRFLSAVSFQYYMYHQVFAVQLKAWGVPPSAYQTPWAAGDASWQWPYTLLCFFGALLIAALITYVYEQPITRRCLKKI